MVQRGEDFSFTLEASQALRIVRERLRQDLERHVPVELGVPGSIHLSHAPLAYEGGHVVVAEAGTDGEGHGSDDAESSSL